MTTGDKIRDIKRPYRKKLSRRDTRSRARLSSTTPSHTIPTPRIPIRPRRLFVPVSTPLPTVARATRGGCWIVGSASRLQQLSVAHGLQGQLLQRLSATAGFWSTINTYNDDGLWLVAGFLTDSYIDAVVVNVTDVLERILGGTALGTAFSTR